MKETTRLHLSVVVSIPAATNFDHLHSRRHEVSSVPCTSLRNLQMKPYHHSDRKGHKEKKFRDVVCMPSSPSISESVDDSVCTEEEIVAVEQLRELKRRREKDTEQNSCSVNTWGIAKHSPTLPPLVSINKKHTSRDSPASSSSGADGHRKSGKKQRNHMSRDIMISECDSNLNDESYLISMTCDFDERVKPKIRLLSDIYNDTKNSQTSMSSGFNNADAKREAMQ